MTEQPVPQPWSDEGVPRCSQNCAAFSSVGRDGARYLAATCLVENVAVRPDEICEPQARLDAAELQRLRNEVSALQQRLTTVNAYAWHGEFCAVIANLPCDCGYAERVQHRPTKTDDTPPAP